MNIHKQELQDQIKNEMVSSYNEFLSELKEELDLNHPFLDEYFSESLTNIIQEDQALENYSPKKFFWFNQIEALIFLIGMCEEYEECDHEADKLEVEEEIFFFWDSSEYSKVFLDYLNEGKSTWEATQEMIPILENQILSYYFIQVSQNYNGEHKLIYNIIPEFGESEEFLYLGDKHQFVKYNGKAFKSFPSILVKSISPEVIELDGQEGELGLTTTLDVEDLELALLPNCKEGFKQEDVFKTDIAKAIKIIKQASPKCYQAFKNFTSTIVPVNEKNIVSYSMQSLPGYSSINMFDRDFVDLMDDLIHENGHHFLNCVLNSKHLMNEDDDKIYYSPWRRALRPIRGIYHAVFTFYWALELFSDLFKAMPSGLSDSEKNKIAFRVTEEFKMLTYCKEDLQHAYEQDKISPEGKELIDSILELIQGHESTSQDAERYLLENSSDLAAQIKELDGVLEQSSKQYR